MLLTANDIFNKWWPRLQPLYDKGEAQRLVKWLLEDYYHISTTDLILGKTIEITTTDPLERAIQRLNTGEPIQHILGYAWFQELKFKVNREVLVPRQETEELVVLIIREHRGFVGKILDIGTGSGIIPICLKKAFTASKVYGLDVSPSALAVAKENARIHQTEIDWLELDILSYSPDQKFDIIVSNPPYVLASDKREMHPNVLNHDPGLALFVPDENPLLFYNRICHLSEQLLNLNGTLYFEIHEKFGEEVKELMQKSGLENVRIHSDLNGKDRIVCGIKKG